MNKILSLFLTPLITVGVFALYDFIYDIKPEVSYGILYLKCVIVYTLIAIIINTIFGKR